MNTNSRFAQLESLVDFYETERTELQNLLVRCGFHQGIASLKESAKALIQEGMNGSL